MTFMRFLDGATEATYTIKNITYGCAAGAAGYLCYRLAELAEAMTRLYGQFGG